ncbi:MAG: radical SAM protein [Candidatus Omnitrophica bacterium]|nr:radical SAM protein [Candidatus Omnitrophota bacterium]
MDTVRKAYRALMRLAAREINYHRIHPRNMLLFLTYRCTSRCKSCRMWRRAEEGDELSLPEWKKVIDDAASCGIRSVEMFGGDALLRKDVLVPLTRYAREKNIPEVDLTTNAFLLDKQTAKELISAGFYQIYVSLDGVGPVHERTRGVDGAFERVTQGLSYLIEARAGNVFPQVVMNCTVSKLNAHGLKELMPLAERLGVDRLAYEYIGEFPQEAIRCSRIDNVAPEPYYTTGADSLLLDRKEALYVKGVLKELRRAVLGRKLEVFTRNIDVLTIDEMTRGVLPHKKCYVCRYQITIDPYGEVLACPFFNRYSLGNVTGSSLRDIWRSPRHRRFISSVDSGKVNMCRHCILGVERNPSIIQELEQAYLYLRNRGRDEDAVY